MESVSTTGIDRQGYMYGLRDAAWPSVAFRALARDPIMGEKGVMSKKQGRR